MMQPLFGVAFFWPPPDLFFTGLASVGGLDAVLASFQFCNLLQLKILKVLNVTSMLINFIHAIQHPSTGA
jgi:hypothetical protein